MGPYRNEPHYGTTQLKMIVLDLEVPTSSPSSQSSSSAGFPFHWRLLRLSQNKICTLLLIKQCIVLVLGADNIAKLAALKTYNQGLIKKLSRSATDITSCARSANVWTPLYHHLYHLKWPSCSSQFILMFCANQETANGLLRRGCSEPNSRPRGTGVLPGPGSALGMLIVDQCCINMLKSVCFVY